MLDLSRETNVRFLRAAGKLLQEKVLRLEKELIEARLLKAADEQLCASLSEELLVLKKKFFGASRERCKSQSPKKRQGRKNLIHDRPAIDASENQSESRLDCEEEIHTLEPHELQCQTGGDCFFEPMAGGFEQAMEVQVTERRYTLKHHKRQKYVCRKCALFKTAPGPDKLLPSSHFSAHMAVQVADDKFNQHLPLERQVRAMAEAGLNVDSKTLYNLTSYLAHALESVPGKIRQEILAQPNVCIDETPMKLLGSDSNGYVWGICNRYGVYYQYETTRSGRVAREMLKGYSGSVMCDGYSGYEWIEQEPNMLLAGCWSHLRRKFHDAKLAHPKAGSIIASLDELFELEHEADTWEDLAVIRKEKSRPLVEKIWKQISAQKLKALPSSLMGKAVIYAENQWPYLMRFLDDVHIPLSNNAAERSLRSPVLGRKNFLGFRTINGADTGMVLYSLINSCRLLKISPKAYLLDNALRSCRGEELLTPYQYGQGMAAKSATS